MKSIKKLFTDNSLINRGLLKQYNIKLPRIKNREKVIQSGKKFKGKVVIITGASSGIGKACAFEFSAQGAKVVLAARRENKLKEIETEIRQQGGDTFFIKTDVKKIDD